MLANVTMYKPIVEGKEIKDDSRYPFMVQDIFGVMAEIGLPNAILVNIDPYNFGNSVDEIKTAVNDIAESDIGDGLVIMSSAYASTKDYPEDKFYDPHDMGNHEEDIKAGKKPVPFDEAIAKQRKILEDAGFTNVNKFCGLEFSEVFVSPINVNGMKVIEKINELCTK